MKKESFYKVKYKLGKPNKKKDCVQVGLKLNTKLRQVKF